MQLLDDFKEIRSYWKRKEEALGRIRMGTRFGKCSGPIVGDIA
jgi:hypothetical protein